MIASSRCIGILKEYEEVLVGAKSALPTIYFSEKSNQKTTCDFLIYVFEGILGWNFEDVRDRLNENIIKKLKLERAINSLEFPPELDPKTDLWYVSCLLYPDVCRYDKDRHIIATYEKILSGKLPRFPKWFFSDYDGDVNASLCLNYALSKNFPNKTIPELYELFSSPRAISFLNDMKLLQPCSHYYETPLDMLHNSLCDEEKDEYRYYLFRLKNILKDSGLPPVLVPVSSYESAKEAYLKIKQEFIDCFNSVFDKMTDADS